VNHPPYHLRPNKAIDRFLLIDVLRRLNNLLDLNDYTYYGFGGPFLEDCRLLHEYFPALSLVSIEKNEQTYKRQKFHRFCRDIALENTSFRDFLRTFNSTGHEIVWMDYTDMRWDRIREFMDLLDTANNGTIIRITVNSEGYDNPYTRSTAPSEQDIEVFRNALKTEFSDAFPTTVPDEALRPGKLPSLFQNIVRIAAEKTLPANTGSIFQPLDSITYTDGTRMLSITGIVWQLSQVKQVAKRLSGWRFANLTWKPPKKVAVPLLSVKERLLLEAHLSAHSNDGKVLAKALGYNVGDGHPDSLRQLEQYAEFHQFCPVFAKVVI